MERSKWSDIPGIRLTKLFQRLSPIATEQLDLFIDQYVALARECIAMYGVNALTQFKLNYSEKYIIYFQLDMFNDIDLNN
jgi:hypothetical protein